MSANRFLFLIFIFIFFILLFCLFYFVVNDRYEIYDLRATGAFKSVEKAEIVVQSASKTWSANSGLIM